MVIAGLWVLGDDAITRPIADVWILNDVGDRAPVRFLLDTGADRTVFNEPVLRELAQPTTDPSGDFKLAGVGGESPFVRVETTLELPEAGGGRAVKVHGKFAAFTDLAALDLSVLGRDVLDRFDVVLGRNRGATLLLGGVHHSQVLSDGRA